MMVQTNRESLFFSLRMTGIFCRNFNKIIIALCSKKTERFQYQ